MKYSEFKTEVEKLGLSITVEQCEGRVRLKTNGTQLYCLISTEDVLAFDTRWDAFISLSTAKKTELFEVVYKLAKTPLAEREEEKRYWLRKIPVPLLDKEGEKKWLWKYMGTAPSNMFGVDTTKIDSEIYKTIFTESEIAQMDITGFQKVEVSND